MNFPSAFSHTVPLHRYLLALSVSALIVQNLRAHSRKRTTFSLASHPLNHLNPHLCRARGIEPRAHRNSERKRQAEAVAAAKERGVEYKVPKSTLQLQTVRVSILIGDALADSPNRLESGSGNGVEIPLANGHHPQDIAPLYPLPDPLPIEIHKVPLPDDLGIKIKEEIDHEIMMTTEIQGNNKNDNTFFCFIYHALLQFKHFDAAY